MADDLDLEQLAAAMLSLPPEQRHALLRAMPPPEPPRYELIREVRRRFYPSHKLRTTAREIADAWKQYETRTWPHDHSAVTCPPRHVGKPQELFWRIMRDWPNSLGHDRIRQILSG